jgi:hypothetical protein
VWRSSFSADELQMMNRWTVRERANEKRQKSDICDKRQPKKKNTTERKIIRKKSSMCIWAFEKKKDGNEVNPSRNINRETIYVIVHQ